MPENEFKKTSMMRQVERRFPGQPLRDIVTNALSTHGTMEAAAAALGISTHTLRRQWMPKLGIQIERTTTVVAAKQ